MKEFPSLGALALHLIEVAAAEYLVFVGWISGAAA